MSEEATEVELVAGLTVCVGATANVLATLPSVK